jgi:hypothetical protein
VTPDPNWAEKVTAIATSVGAVGLLGGLGAAVVALQQVREQRKSRHAQLGAEFVRRWNEESLVETRRFVAEYKNKEELSKAFQGFIATNSANAYVLYRELDYFEQLGALDELGAVDFELIKLLLGQTLVDRWEMWEPSLRAMPVADPYPMFGALVAKMRKELR